MKNTALDKAVIYNVYPTSFFDSDGDGIGDLKGIADKLDYIAGLADWLWINPVFVSPFRDGGYDIADYYGIDKRFGTTDDLKELLVKAKKRGVKVLLDLVVGHTSDEHPWFLQSQKAERNKYSDYYIWSDKVFEDYPYKMISGNSERAGNYMINFFCFQPALNFGFAQVRYPWQFDYRSEVCMEIRREVVKVIEYYMEMGVAGFRVDMANSIVKDDPDGKCSAEVWRDIFGRVREKYPEAVFVSEWGEPAKAVCGDCFDVDFLTHCHNDGYNRLFRKEKGANIFIDDGGSFFRKEGRGEADTFFEYFESNLASAEKHGYICVPTGNHDLPRISLGRSEEELKTVFAFLFALPCIPLVYYGDEIGMPYENLTSKDGGYARTGSRTPMRWSENGNAGFSTAAAEKLYLPIGGNLQINVQEQESREDSLYSLVKKLSDIRRASPCLGVSAEYRCINRGYPLVIRRGSNEKPFYALINPSSREYCVKLNCSTVLASLNAELGQGEIRLKGCSFAWVIGDGTGGAELG